MLGASGRLRSSKEIKEVVRYGRRIQTPFVRIHYLPKPGQAASRVACVVGIRVHRSAVSRHRYQRWLRHYARDLLASYSGVIAYDIVLVGLPALAQVTRSQELRSSLEGKLSPLFV